MPATDFEISFSNGTDVTGIYTVTDGKESFITPEKDEIFASKEDAIEALELRIESVYFFNTGLWDNVNCYAWLDGGEQLLGGWPGKAAYNEGGYWYRADLKLPKNHEGGYNVIFNFNGTQTQDIKIDDEKVYVALNADQPGGSLQVTR